jgi:hypothetical protein
LVIRAEGHSRQLLDDWGFFQLSAKDQLQYVFESIHALRVTLDAFSRAVNGKNVACRTLASVSPAGALGHGACVLVESGTWRNCFGAGSGKLFPADTTRLFVYPENGDEGEFKDLTSVSVPHKLRDLYRQLVVNGFISGIDSLA